MAFWKVATGTPKKGAFLCSFTPSCPWACSKGLSILPPAPVQESQHSAPPSPGLGASQRAGWGHLGLPLAMFTLELWRA